MLERLLVLLWRMEICLFETLVFAWSMKVFLLQIVNSVKREQDFLECKHGNNLIAMNKKINIQIQTISRKEC